LSITARGYLVDYVPYYCRAARSTVHHGGIIIAVISGIVTTLMAVISLQ
jgi:hypothetical protein